MRIGFVCNFSLINLGTNNMEPPISTIITEASIQLGGSRTPEIAAQCNCPDQSASIAIHCDTSCLAGVTAATVMLVALAGVAITFGNLWAVLRYRNPRKPRSLLKDSDKESSSIKSGSKCDASKSAKTDKDRDSRSSSSGSRSSSYSSEDHVY